VSRLALGPTQPPVRYIPWAFSSDGNTVVAEACHIFPSNGEFNISWSNTSIPIHICGLLLGTILLFTYKNRTFTSVKTLQVVLHVFLGLF
jgi:hypothetical protein